MKRHPRAVRLSACALSVALALPGVGIWAEDTAGSVRDATPGTAVQTPAAPDAAAAPPDSAPPAADTNPPVTPDPAPAAPDQVPTTPGPDQAAPQPPPAPGTPDADRAAPQEPVPAPAPDPAPAPAPVTPDPNQAPTQDQAPTPDPAPAPDAAPPADQTPAPPPAPVAPDATPAPAPDPAPTPPDAAPRDQTPADQPAAPGVADGTQPAPMGAEAFSSPMQEFVSHNVHEVAMLSRQIDHFQAAGRRDVVRALQHMIRDHVLVSDAAQNVLARQNQPSNPVIMPVHEMPASSEEMIRTDIQEHERMLAQTQQLLAGATNEAERSVYQQAVNATQKHLGWLRNLEQGQQVQVGYFGPTMPLARIAGYREQVRVGRGAGAARSVAPRRGSRRSGARGAARRGYR